MGGCFGAIGLVTLPEPLHFQVQEEASITALPQQFPLRLMLHKRAWRESSVAWAWLAYWLPRSECTNKPAEGFRLSWSNLDGHLDGSFSAEDEKSMTVK